MYIHVHVHVHVRRCLYIIHSVEVKHIICTCTCTGMCTVHCVDVNMFSECVGVQTSKVQVHVYMYINGLLNGLNTDWQVSIRLTILSKKAFSVSGHDHTCMARCFTLFLVVFSLLVALSEGPFRRPCHCLLLQFQWIPQ